MDLETHLNKVQVVTVTGDSKQPGYYCDVCDCTLKDSVAYLDHINGRRRKMLPRLAERLLLKDKLMHRVNI